MFPFLPYLSFYYRIPFPKSGCFASREMIVFFRVWLSERDDFRRVFLDLFCGGWLWHVLCVVYNVGKLHLFCTIIFKRHGRVVCREVCGTYPG